MKQQLLKKTWLRSLLLAAITLLTGATSVWGESIEINTTNSGVTGSYQDKEFDVNDITFKFTQWMKSTNIQAKKSTTNSLYNIDAIPGTITSIVVVQTGTARAITIYGGTSEKPTNQITSPTTAATMTFDFTGNNYSYFSLKTPSNACYFDKITINYTPSGSTDPSISASDVDIVYDATSGSISYTIDNPTSETLSASTTSDWLTVGTVGESSVPFTCSANSAKTSRTATVTLTYGTVTKNVTITQAGNPNVVDNISDITAAGTYSIKGTIVAKSQRGFIVGDGTGYVYYYNTSYTQADYNIGDKVQLVGSVVAFGGVFEFNSSTTITSATESNYVAEDPTVLSGSDMDARVASTSPAQLSTYVQYEGTLSVSGSYYNITDIDGASTAQGSISYPISTDFTSLDGKTVKVTGYYVGVSSSKYYNTLIGTIEEVAGAAPIINASDINISCDATSGEITYSIANAVEGVNLTANTTSDWLTLGTISDGSVPFTCSANTESEARTATITLSYAGADDVTVTVTQNYFVADYATLPFEFDGGVSDIATTAGLTQSGLGSDYSSAPKLKFDGSGDYVILHFNERPGTLTFDVKGNGFSGGTFKVQTSVDGETYTDLETYTTITGTLNESFNNLGADVRYIKWIYTEKSSGNVALGNITLAQYAAPQAYTLTIPTIENATVTAAYNTNDILAEGESAEIEQGTEIILTVDAATGYTLQSLTVTGPDGQSFSPTAVSGSEGAYRFTMPAYNATISVTVEEYVAPVLATYVLATSITSGKHYVIASGTEGSVHVMGDQATNNRPAVAATIDDDGKLSVSDAYEFVIESATIDEASGYSIFDAGDNGYLYAASSSSNHLKTQETNNANGIWSITIDEDGVASIVAQGANSRNVMQYNSSSTLFSCYSSASQGAVYLFVKEETEEPITVTISAAGYSTLYYGTKNLTVPTGMEAYTVKVTTKVERSKTYNAGDVIPAGEPVVLKAAAGTYEFTVAAEAGAKDANNMLKGNDVKTLTTGGTYYYALTLNANKDVDSAGFYWMVANGAAYQAGAHKAYLALDKTFTELAEGTSTGVKGFLALPGNDADGIESIDNATFNNTKVFNLAGQRVKHMNKGIYVVGGKKVLVK